VKRGVSRLALVGLVAGACFVLSNSSKAWCQGTGFLTSYYDVATSNSASASGYGGNGASGGVGDGLVRMILPGHGENSAGDNIQHGTHCAMIYVFDDIEEMQACCGCPVTPDGLRTMSVINNVTKNFGVNRGNLNAGVIDIASIDPNFEASKQIPLPPQIGPIGIGTNGAFLACDPSGQYGPNVGASSATFAAADLEAEGTDGGAMVAYITHTEANVPVPASHNLTRGVSVDEFQNARPDDPHLTELQNFCYFLIQNGSGTGACSCGSGDNWSKSPNPIL